MQILDDKMCEIGGDEVLPSLANCPATTPSRPDFTARLGQIGNPPGYRGVGKALFR